MKPSLYGKTHTLKLTAGVKIRVRRPSILSLLAAGGFPSTMTNEMFKIVNQDKPTKDLTPEAIRSWANVMDAFLPFVVIEPKIVSGTDQTDLQEDDDLYLHGQVNVKDIIDVDKQTIFLYGNGAMLSDDEVEDRKERKAGQPVDLTRFPEGTERDDAGSGSEEVRPEAVAVGGAAAA